MPFTEIDAATLGIIIEGILYGAYAVLFILYLVLRRRNHRVTNEPLTLAQILLFGLCTISLCLDISGAYFFIVPDVANLHTYNTIEMILVYRCWIIWDKRWVVVTVPGFLALTSLGGGFVLVGLYKSPLWKINPEKVTRLYKLTGTITSSILLGVNALTTSLIVTKILLISREVYPNSRSTSHRSLRIVTAMLIESGLLTFAVRLILVVIFSTQLPTVDMFCGPITQISGITSTLLSLRVAMGSAYGRTTEKTKTHSLRFTHSRGPAIQTTTPSMNAVQSRVIDINLDDNEGALDLT